MNNHLILTGITQLMFLDKAFENGLFALIIGPKGTGKTSLVRGVCNTKIKRIRIN